MLEKLRSTYPQPNTANLTHEARSPSARKRAPIREANSRTYSNERRPPAKGWDGLCRAANPAASRPMTAISPAIDDRGGLIAPLPESGAVSGLAPGPRGDDV